MIKKGFYYSIVEELNRLPWKRIWKNYQIKTGRYYFQVIDKHLVKTRLDNKDQLRKLISHSIFKYCSYFVNGHPLDSLKDDEFITLFNIDISWTSGGWKATIDYAYEQLHLEDYGEMLKHESKQGYQQASKYLTKVKLKK